LEKQIVTDEVQVFEYAKAEDVPARQKFSTTRKAGYVEDEVDVWVENSLNAFVNFLDKYNSLVYAHDLLKKDYEELELKLTAAQATYAAPVQAAYEAPAEVAYEAPAEVVYEAVEAPVETPEEAPEEEVAVAYEAPAEVVYTPLDTSSASRRAREIMDAAAEEAAEHVSRALDRVGRIEAEAIEEANEIRHDAQVLADTLISEATAEADLAIELKNTTIVERDAIFARLELFYGSQLKEIQNTKDSAGYSPLPDVNAVYEAPIAPTVENTYEEDIKTALAGPIDSIEIGETRDDEAYATLNDEEATYEAPEAVEETIDEKIVEEIPAVEEDAVTENYDYNDAPKIEESVIEEPVIEEDVVTEARQNEPSFDSLVNGIKEENKEDEDYTYVPPTYVPPTYGAHSEEKDN
jgi:hypothetical protein